MDGGNDIGMKPSFLQETYETDFGDIELWDEELEGERRDVFMDHLESTTYRSIRKIETGTGAMYINHRYTVLDGDWTEYPLHMAFAWMCKKLGI